MYRLEKSQKEFVVTCTRLAKIMHKQRAVTTTFPTNTEKFVKRVLKKAWSSIPVVEERFKLLSVEESCELSPVKLCGGYGYGERSFCVKYLDDNKLVLIHGWNQDFVVMDVMVPEKTRYEEHHIDLSAGQFLLGMTSRYSSTSTLGIPGCVT
jgi:hypothetical protein